MELRGDCAADSYKLIFSNYNYLTRDWDNYMVDVYSHSAWHVLSLGLLLLAKASSLALDLKIKIPAMQRVIHFNLSFAPVRG